VTKDTRSHAVKVDWRSPKWWWRVLKNSAQKLWQERNKAIGYLIGSLMLSCILWVLVACIAHVFSQPPVPFWLTFAVALVVGAVNLFNSR
jgi:hypothetical protein